VRGASGYGKTFLDLDDGFRREDSYKDIDALLDWIETQPELDPQKILVSGGSYGGHMTLAVSYLYSDRIACSLDIVGMSSLVTFLENTEGYRRDLRRVEYGDERDPEMRAYLESIALLSHANQIRKLLVVIQGKNGSRASLPPKPCKWSRRYEIATPLSGF
jgi:dipeptidyl aminopeptidase/acylaminoacyl peptidase